LAGFFEDDTTKKPVIPVAPAAVPVVVQAIQEPAVIIPEPVKAPIADAVVPEVSEAALNVVAIETPVETGEKIAEPIVEVVEVAEIAPEKLDAEIAAIEAAENEILAPAASEIALTNEIPAAAVVAAQPEAVVATAPESVVAAVAPVKQTSEEEEGLIEGIVNTLILDDGEEEEDDDASFEILRDEKKKPVADDDDDGLLLVCIN